MVRQQDAHVRTHERLVQRVMGRWIEWGAPKRLEGETDDERWQRMRAAVMAVACSERCWSHANWRAKYGRYEPFYGADVVGEYKNPPAFIVHGIMCAAARLLSARGTL